MSAFAQVAPIKIPTVCDFLPSSRPRCWPRRPSGPGARHVDAIKTYTYYCMHMAALEHRLQILLDEDRYSTIAGEAERTGRSIAAIIRDAIDARIDTDEQRRRVAARRLLEMASTPTDEPGEDWEDMKAAWEDELAGRIP